MNIVHYLMAHSISSLRILIILCFFLGACQTKPFKKVQIKGRIFDAKTGQPILGSLMLKTDEKKGPQGDPSVVLITSKSQIDGSFTLKSNASKRKDALYYVYYKNDTIADYFNLDVNTGKASSGNNYYFTLSENQTYNVGDVYIKW